MFSVFTVCFFGHRRIDNFQAVELAVESLIRKIVSEHSYVEFLTGRDGDFDQIVTSAIRRYKKSNDTANCSLTWIMPYMKDEYKHNQESFESYYDSVEPCEASAQAHPKAAIQIRNRAMIDRADLCVFYVIEKKGGAYKTLRYAEKTNVDIINLAAIT